MAAKLPSITAMFLFIVILFHLVPDTLQAPEAAGKFFSVDLIHRDYSPLSPFYNSSETILDRLKRDIRRSSSRLDYFHRATSTASIKKSNGVISKVIPNGGAYLMNISLGTPPVPILALADTGSDLTWTQCEPCKECYKQYAPYFNPNASSTYRDLPCTSKLCDAAISQSSCNITKICNYTISYGDFSSSQGVLASETLTMASSSMGSGRRRAIRVPNIAFGCGHHNSGNFKKNEAGIVGLGRGPLSLVSQLGSSIDKRFAYCLVPLNQKINATSTMVFGRGAVVSGNGAVSTPLISKKGNETFYYVTLKSITLGNKRINISVPQQPAHDQKGNILIDSGTTITYLPTAVYKDVLSALNETIVSPIPPIILPFGPLQFCYNFTRDHQAKIPDMKFDFDGAELVLGPLNTFFKLSEGLTCAAFLPSNGLWTPSIFGNVAQQNFKVGYDLQNMKVTFQKTDCAVLKHRV